MNKWCFTCSASDGRVSGQGGFGGSLLSLPEDVDLGPTKCSVNFLNHSGRSCTRLHDARVVSRSSGVDSLVVSADFSSELEGCASLDTPRTTISTNLSHLQGTTLPFSIRFGFLPSFQSYECPISSQNVPRDSSVGVSSSNWTVTNMSKSFIHVDHGLLGRVDSPCSPLSQSREVVTL